MVRWDFFATLKGMRKGDSFFIPCLQCDEYRTRIRWVANKLGVKLTIRPWNEEYLKGLRIWRTL